MDSGKVFFLVIAVIIIVFVWCNSIRTEEKYRAEYETYVRDKLFQKNYVEKDINEIFQLREGEKLLICGVNHWETIQTHWEFKIYDEGEETFYKMSPNENAPGKNKFWNILVSSRPQKDHIVITSKSFRLNDTIWTRRSGLLYPKVYLITN